MSFHLLLDYGLVGMTLDMFCRPIKFQIPKRNDTIHFRFQVYLSCYILCINHHDLSHTTSLRVKFKVILASTKRLIERFTEV